MKYLEGWLRTNKLGSERGAFHFVLNTRDPQKVSFLTNDDYFHNFIRLYHVGCIRSGHHQTSEINQTYQVQFLIPMAYCDHKGGDDHPV